ncbi:HdaA/DnaA family protein [Marinicella litoralis]|uniref:Regulatory inactivation of DnaA Hda protein n=1 Tax=Marinicella litoralis TaxID=644220 RepID=A0A4R6XG75_9GAMM|nr:DnaA/Hda family protein [Marinicella litoralis]TDR16267.1 regulatory inactivation of DnaA Hda protein [Marinicella litoralis]
MNQSQVPLPLNNKDPFLFGDFIGNEEVVDALSRFEQLPQFTYLWGVEYSGKSHLMSALNGLLESAEVNFLILDANMIADEHLVNHLPAQIKFLLINDIDTVASDSVGEVALFNLYNYCLAHHCKLVVSSSISPRSDQWMLPDLQSRLNSGLVLSLEMLKGDQALKCIEHQFAMNGIPLESAVVKYLKTTQNTSYSYLYQLFMRLSAETLKLKKKLTVPLVKKALQDYQDSM